MSRNGAEKSLKGKYRLSLGPLPDRILERLGRRQIDGNAKQIFQAILQMHHVDEAETPLGIEIRNQVDIGCRRFLTAGDRAVKTQMGDAGGSQFRLVVTQRLDHGIPIHTPIVARFPDRLNWGLGRSIFRISP
jgi:hypothetical protein